MTTQSASSSRVAIVTGGSRGIGRAVAERLASDGFAVAVVYAGNRAAADVVVASIEAFGGSALAFQADIADEVAVGEVFDAVIDRFGGVDVVVNSAGLMRLAKLVDFDLAVLDQVHRTNIRGAFVVNQLAAKHTRPGGAIINLSTSVVGLAFPDYSVYSASKGAVEALTLILARELRGHDMTVNAVAPGPTATDLFLDGKDTKTMERLSQQPPLQRLGTPEDIANVIAFLASPEGHWVDGQIIRANGGIV